MRNAIITGATSFIGVHLISELLRNDYSVTAIVRPNSIHLSRIPIDKRIIIVELDMQEIQKLPDILHEKEYEIFYHLAWDGVRAPYRDDKLLQFSNYNSSIKAFEIAVMLKCKVFVGSGSQAEYGKCSGKITEDYTPDPQTEYGKAKLTAYKTLSGLSENNRIRFIWTRIFSVYGKYDYEGTLVMSAIKSLYKNVDLQLTECKQCWDFIHVEDVARAMYLLSSNEYCNGIYNIASGDVRELKEFVSEMKRIIGSSSKLEYGAINYGIEGIVSFEPVIDKLKDSLNWSCKISYEEGIVNLVQYLKQEGYI